MKAKDRGIGFPRATLRRCHPLRRFYASRLAFFASAVGCVLFLQIGCQKQVVVRKPEVGEIAPSKQVVRLGGPETPREGCDLPGSSTEELTPRITFEKVVYDFGKVAPRTKNTGGFIFTNTGKSLLKITRIEGCGGVTAESDKKEYEPGESGTLKLEYCSSARPGMMMGWLRVKSNDKAQPSVTLSVKANVVPKVVCEPKRLTLPLKDESVSCLEITLTSLDDKPFSVKGFRSTGGCITADLDPSVKATTFLLGLNVDTKRLQESPKGLIEIILTHPECNRVILPFAALPRFEANPSSIIVFNAEPGEPIRREFRVLSNYGEDFEVESASSKNNIIKVLSEEKVRNGYQFTLEITPHIIESKPLIFTDVFFVNIEGGERLEITCRGTYSH